MAKSGINAPKKRNAKAEGKKTNKAQGAPQTTEETKDDKPPS